MKPRVRFAPSPTGIPHIGNTRTALFNYLFTKHHGGDFILRIEDTDQDRYVPESLEKILEILKSVGIDWDEGPKVGGPYQPYEQSKRLHLYKLYAEKLVKKNAAFYCFCTKQRLDNMRKKQQKQGKITHYDGLCRNLSSHQIRDSLKQNSSYVIRLKVPSKGTTSWNDLVQDKIEFKNSLIDDQVLLKSDGYPTYHLGVVVDDHLMKITHILRGAEWISSTPKHLLLYQAFNWQPPKIGHFSIILGPDKTKLSKRHGARSVLEYLKEGYLPESLTTFMAYLGWSYKDNSELLTKDQLIKLFDLKKAHKQNPIFDIEKLNYFNGKAIRKKTTNQLIELTKSFIPKNWHTSNAKLNKVIPLIKDRLVTLADVKELAEFFFVSPQVKKDLILKHAHHSSAQTRQYLNQVINKLKTLKSFNQKTLEPELRSLAKQLSWKPRAAFMTLRIIVTGREATPPLFETLEVIGQQKVANRLSYAHKLLKN